MLHDPDEYFSRADEHKDLKKTLSALRAVSLNEWDTDFVDSLTDKLEKYGDRVRVSSLQWEQLERMRRQYDIE